MTVVAVNTLPVRAELFEGFDSIVSTVRQPHDTLGAESWWHLHGLSSQLLLSLCDSSCLSPDLFCDLAQSDSTVSAAGGGQRELNLEWDRIKLQGLLTRNLFFALPFPARPDCQKDLRPLSPSSFHKPPC
ncbi:hypothetical protein LDENG_00090200 [Lucifuga dentata]|nr:hypothetical protein LDENG_00090200 [Lucifuga dentata]